ncbi:MAG: hypothetical protein ABJB61_07965 [bacterium]
MKYIHTTTIIALFIYAICPAAVGRNAHQQGPDSRHCPTIAVECPSALGSPKSITFKANVKGTTSEIRYHWEVSAGTILEGQGTSSITVDTSGLGGQTITAAVDVSGLANVCAHTASCSSGIFDEPPMATLFDRYYPKSVMHSTSKKRTAKRKGARSYLIRK